MVPLSFGKEAKFSKLYSNDNEFLANFAKIETFQKSMKDLNLDL